MKSECRTCVKPQGEIIDGICEKCLDVMQRYIELGILNMAHAPYMKVYFVDSEILVSLRYNDLKDVIEDEE